LKRLAQCHELLQELAKELIKHRDVTVLEGHRAKVKQDEYFEKGFSKVQFPNSKHNKWPSQAFDIGPYPLPDWNDVITWAEFVGFVRGVAMMMGIKIRSGLDWDNDFCIREHKFLDYPHFEIILEEDEDDEE
jgi:peptidoglycan L-alanyl-D-glutamate endopeptidase CwlK